MASEIEAWLIADAELQPFRLEILRLVGRRAETIADVDRLFAYLEPLAAFIAGKTREESERLEKPSINTKTQPLEAA